MLDKGFNLKINFIRTRADDELKMVIEAAQTPSKHKLAKFKIEEMTWVEVKEALEEKGVDTVVVPIGAVEQHGPHGVFGTDAFCAQVVAEKVATRLDALLAPLLPYGLSSSHMHFKGTISLSASTFSHVVRDILWSLLQHGFKKIAIINGNEPNFYPAIVEARDMREKTNALITISNWYASLQEIWKEAPGIKGTNKENWSWSYFMAHGGMLETSVAMAYKEEIVRLDLATTYPSDRREAFSNSAVSLPSRMEDVAPKGSYGDPLDSNADLGKFWIELAASRIAEKIKGAWKAAATPPL